MVLYNAGLLLFAALRLHGFSWIIHETFQAPQRFEITNLWAILILSSLRSKHRKSQKGKSFADHTLSSATCAFCINLHPSPTTTWYAVALLDIIERYIDLTQANLAHRSSQGLGPPGAYPSRRLPCSTRPSRDTRFSKSHFNILRAYHDGNGDNSACRPWLHGYDRKIFHV